MPEAVIVDSVRTPVGRAFKGSLAQLRPDETGAFVDRPAPRAQPRRRARTRSRRSSPAAACRRASRRFNIGRIMVLLSEKLPETTNGSTVARYCASGLDAIRIAANNVVAGQGDTYIAAGVSSSASTTSARRRAGEADQNEKLQGKEPGQPNATSRWA